MSNFAGFNSSKFVKGRLQAALYYARKRRRQRESGGGGGGGGTPDGALLTKDGSSYLTTKSGDPIVVE